MVKSSEEPFQYSLIQRKTHFGRANCCCSYFIRNDTKSKRVTEEKREYLYHCVVIWLKRVRFTIYIFSQRPDEFKRGKMLRLICVCMWQNKRNNPESNVKCIQMNAFNIYKLLLHCVRCACVCYHQISSQSIEFYDVLCISSNLVNVRRLFSQFWRNLMSASRF